MDYLFYSDADMRFEANVGEEVLGELVATRHPGFYDKPYSFFSQSYERRPQSLAYMPPNYGSAYYAGGFNGGRAARYLQMAEEILSDGKAITYPDFSGRFDQHFP
jgi:histo-blood group ABO system transferase